MEEVLEEIFVVVLKIVMEKVPVHTALLLDVTLNNHWLVDFGFVSML